MGIGLVMNKMIIAAAAIIPAHSRNASLLPAITAENETNEIHRSTELYHQIILI